MKMKSVLLSGVLAVGTAGAVYGFAQGPVEGVRPGRHPNLAAAQRLTAQAYQRIVAAQQANEYDMNGHAQKAKELLDEANRELGMAAGAANANR